MMHKEFYIPKYILPKEFAAIRKNLGLTQKDLALILGVSKPTIERWEAGSKPITGPAVIMMDIFKKTPEQINNYILPPKKYPLRLLYKSGNTLCTLIDVNERLQEVAIINYTNDIMLRAFGKIEQPTYDQYEVFLESRCFPRERDKMKLILRDLDLPFYDPLLIIEKTKGRMSEDNFSLEIA